MLQGAGQESHTVVHGKLQKEQPESPLEPQVSQAALHVGLQARGSPRESRHGSPVLAGLQEAEAVAPGEPQPPFTV